MKYLNIKE